MASRTGLAAIMMLAVTAGAHAVVHGLSGRGSGQDLVRDVAMNPATTATPESANATCGIARGFYDPIACDGEYLWVGCELNACCDTFSTAGLVLNCSAPVGSFQFIVDGGGYDVELSCWNGVTNCTGPKYWSFTLETNYCQFGDGVFRDPSIGSLTFTTETCSLLSQLP